ncbi:MAG: hypothetical protein LKF96_01235 [Treponema sp.]|jgi:hypothetical protein|nr:hypothetical protein [Treponema sp.]
MKAFPFFLLLLAVLSLPGCFLKPHEETVHFDTANPLSLAPDIEWVAITEPYVGFHSMPDWSSAVSEYCRRGDVFQIEGKKLTETGKGQVWWYLFDAGWLPQSAVAVYSNRFKALTAASQLVK